MDRTAYILAMSTTFTCLNCGVLSASNTVLFMYIDRNVSDRPSSIFIVCVTLPWNMVAAVTTWEKQHEHTMCLIMWQEFSFRSLTQSGLQNFAQQHLDIKFRAIGNIRHISVHPDSCYSEECRKMGMSYKTGVLQNFGYVKVGTG